MLAMIIDRMLKKSAGVVRLGAAGFKFLVSGFTFDLGIPVIRNE